MFNPSPPGMFDTQMMQISGSPNTYNTCSTTGLII